MQDKISLLMTETGCDQGEAELALEMCGYEVEQAIKAIGRLHKNIVVFKGRFSCPEQTQFGLLLIILNLKSRSLVRCRAVLSFNPAVFTLPLEKDWFEFEKQLYACRLWEGSLPPESLEIERALTASLRGGGAVFEPGEEALGAASDEILGALRAALRCGGGEVKLKRDVLDMGQFQSLRTDAGGPASRRRQPVARDEEILVLKAALEESPDGVPAAELRSGDVVEALIVDNRDIGLYLARLFGGHSERGPVPVMAPVEAIESTEDDVLVRVRFSSGVAGDAQLRREGRYRAHRAPSPQEAPASWWRRFFR